MGARANGEPCGTIGDVGCFSFFSNKNLPVGEGGMIVTDDGELAAQMRLLRSHGMTTLTWDRHRGHASTYDVVAPASTTGSTSFGRRSEACSWPISPSATPHARCTSPATAPHSTAPPASSSRSRRTRRRRTHLSVVLLPESAQREHVRAQLAEAGVQTSVHYPPMHEFAVFAMLVRDETSRGRPPSADRILTLPLYPHMTADDVDLVVAELLEAVA